MIQDIKDLGEFAQDVKEIGLNRSNKLKLKYKTSTRIGVMADSIAEIFLEIASEQRLQIIQKISEKNYKISTMSKEIQATMPEVHRNFNRLVKAGLIEKNASGDYSLTVYGNLICKLFPTLEFMEKNKSYFKNHNFGNLPSKFVSRIGELVNGELISGYVKVIDKWKDIYENSEKYIKNVLIEVSYSKEIVDILSSKLKSEIKVNSLFLESAIVSKERKKVLEQKKFEKFLRNDAISRKMDKNLQIIIVANEIEAGVSFPTNDRVPDLSKMLYSKDSNFCQWCLDYFEYSWKKASAFNENKLKS